ncbi:hypothetical protein C0995_008486 [Termitomyces sp. Mi166|nr:hypothetical protein C0995_008486 [Termitomyces sp. Mi166\
MQKGSGLQLCSYNVVDGQPQNQFEADWYVDTVIASLPLTSTALSVDGVPPRPICKFWESRTCKKGKNCRFAHPDPTEDPDHPVKTSYYSSPATSPMPDTPLPSIPDDGTTKPDHFDNVDSKEEENDNAEAEVVRNQYAESTDNQLHAKTNNDNSCDGFLPCRVWEDHPLSETQDSGDTSAPQQLEGWGDEVCDEIKEGIENAEIANDPQQSTEWGDESSISSPRQTGASAAGDDSGQLEEMGNTQDGESMVDPSSGEFANESPPEPLEEAQTSDVFHVPEQNSDSVDLDSTWVRTDSGFHVSDLRTSKTSDTPYSTEVEGSEPSPCLDATGATNVREDGSSRLTNDGLQWPNGNNYQNSVLSLSLAQHWTQYADPTADLRVPFCKFHARGQCSQGNACRFRHSLSPNEYALLFHDTQPQLSSSAQAIYNDQQAPVMSAFNICKFYPLGRCRNGDACPYLHVPSAKLLPDTTEESPPALPEAELRVLQTMRMGRNKFRMVLKGSISYANGFAKATVNMETGANFSTNPPARTTTKEKDLLLVHRVGDDVVETGMKSRNGGIDSLDHVIGIAKAIVYSETGAGYTDDQDFGQAGRPLEDGATSGDWGGGGSQENSRDAADEWVSQEQPRADDSVADTSADIDDGWNPNAAGWENPIIDEWSRKEEDADANSSRHSDGPSLNGSTSMNKGKSNAASCFRSCRDYTRGRCKRGESCSFSHEITDSRNAPAKISDGQRQTTADNDGWWGQMPHEDEDDPWAINQDPCPYYKKGHCKKGSKCNLNHTPNDNVTSKRQVTPQNTTPWTPVHPPGAEPSQPVSEKEDSPSDSVIDGDHWHIPQGSEVTQTATSAGGWPDSESENEHTPWAFTPRPVCYFFRQGHCKKGDKCFNRHERGEPPTIVETSKPAAKSESDPPIEVSIEETGEEPALGDKLAPVAQTQPSSKDNSDEQVLDTVTKSLDDDEKTWSVDWPQPDIESLPPPKIQAPCKAFGQGHCPMGDSCIYLHIVENTVKDRSLARLPATAVSKDFRYPDRLINERCQPVNEPRGVHIDEPDQVSVEEEEVVATDRVPAITTAVEEEGDLVVERALFNCIVRFGLDNGCSPTEIVAASDTRHAIISNLPPDISHREATELVQTIDEDNGLQAIELDIDQTRANVIARFNTPRQAENAVIKLHGQMFDTQLMTTWRSEESIQPPLESRTVKINWSAPSRSAWFYYSKISLAKTHEKRLDGMNIDGRKIKAEFARPRPSDTTYAVKVNGFHVNTDEEEYKKLAQDTQLVHKNAPTYTECPLDNIRDTLAARGSLERFYRLPLDPKSAKHTAFARFEHGIDAVLGVHGKQQAYLDKGSLSLQRVFHANYQISDRTYQAVSGVLEKLSETVAAAQCTLDLYYGAGPPVDIHLYADAASVAAATFGKANRALYDILLGEIMTEEDTPVPIWDEYFKMTSSSRAIEKLNKDSSFFIKVDKRRRLVRVLGDEANRAKARNGVLKILKMVRMKRHVIPLDIRGIRILVDGGYTRLQEELGGAHKVTLDLAIPEFVVWGDVELEKAKAALAAATSPENSIADVDGTENRCFVCKRRPREPVKLSCTHVYCTACLQYVLLASAGTHFVPPRCLAGCEEYIPYATVRDVLPMQAEDALLENAFLAYIGCLIVHIYADSQAKDSLHLHSSIMSSTKPTEQIHPTNLPDASPDHFASALEALVDHSTEHTDVGQGIHTPMHDLLRVPWIHKLIPGIEKLAVAYHVGNYYIVRSTGEPVFESMPIYARVGMHLLFYGRGRAKVLGTQTVEHLLREQSIKEGRIYDSPLSVKSIPSFVRTYKIDTSELLQPDITAYKTFNEFFSRKLKPGARPIDSTPDALCSAADSRLTVYTSADAARKFWIKGKQFTIPALLNAPPSSPYSEIFANASLAIFRLAPSDYHRFHAPVDCTVRETIDVPGQYYTVNPQAVNEPGFDVFTANRRSALYLEHTGTGKPIVVVAIGALLVGSVVWTGGVQPGRVLKKGDELGYFAYGGSTVVAVFPEGTVEFDQDLVQNSEKPIETLVKVGERIGKIL